MHAKDLMSYSEFDYHWIA